MVAPSSTLGKESARRMARSRSRRMQDVPPPPPPPSPIDPLRSVLTCPYRVFLQQIRYASLPALPSFAHADIAVPVYQSSLPHPNPAICVPSLLQRHRRGQPSWDRIQARWRAEIQQLFDNNVALELVAWALIPTLSVDEEHRQQR